jgi:CMP-N,N'-diacetyllegionaminic acid synthase
MEKYTALIAVRKGSQRIKGKNIKPFCDSSLLEIKIQQAKRCSLIDEVVVSSDCEEMLQVAKKLGVFTQQRDEYFCSNSVPMNLVYEYLANNTICDHIVYLHVTSPLLSDESLKKSINTYKEKIKLGYDSLASVEKVKKYLWYEEKPVNYDPDNHPKSQDLPSYLGLNFAINIISRKKMIKRKNILGCKFYPFLLNEFESIDVDNEFEFSIAEYLYKKRKNEHIR